MTKKMDELIEAFKYALMAIDISNSQTYEDEAKTLLELAAEQSLLVRHMLELAKVDQGEGE